MDFDERDTVEKAIDMKDDIELLNLGAHCYREGNYKAAVELYRLSAAMGNEQAMSNLGYCYQYGRSIEKNEELAYYYFKMSTGVIDSVYNLGKFYEMGIYVEKSSEKADYYYELALKKVQEEEEDDLDYPSVFYANARRLIYKDHEDKAKIFEYLIIAKNGFEYCIDNGESYYEKSLEKVLELLNREEFKELYDNYKKENDEE